MIISSPVSKINTNQNLEFNNFKMQINAKSFKVLYKDIYKDPLISFIREILSNAIDAVNVSGTKRIKILAPTLATNEILLEHNQNLTIRDYGTGLSQDEMINIYTNFFVSTKDTDSKAIGGYGLGSKSPFAYSDMFSVTSYYNGREITYMLVIKDGIPSFTKLSDVPTIEPNGLMVSVPIKTDDYKKVNTILNERLSILTKKYKIETNVQLNELIASSNDGMVDLYMLSYDHLGADRRSVYYIKYNDVLYQYNGCNVYMFDDIADKFRFLHKSKKFIVVVDFESMKDIIDVPSNRDSLEFDTSNNTDMIRKFRDVTLFVNIMYLIHDQLCIQAKQYGDMKAIINDLYSPDCSESLNHKDVALFTNFIKFNNYHWDTIGFAKLSNSIQELYRLSSKFEDEQNLRLTIESILSKSKKYTRLTTINTTLASISKCHMIIISRASDRMKLHIDLCHDAVNTPEFKTEFKIPKSKHVILTLSTTDKVLNSLCEHYKPNYYTIIGNNQLSPYVDFPVEVKTKAAKVAPVKSNRVSVKDTIRVSKELPWYANTNNSKHWYRIYTSNLTKDSKITTIDDLEKCIKYLHNLNYDHETYLDRYSTRSFLYSEEIIGDIMVVHNNDIKKLPDDVKLLDCDDLIEGVAKAITSNFGFLGVIFNDILNAETKGYTFKYKDLQRFVFNRLDASKVLSDLYDTSFNRNGTLNNCVMFMTNVLSLHLAKTYPDLFILTDQSKVELKVEAFNELTTKHFKAILRKVDTAFLKRIKLLEVMDSDEMVGDLSLAISKKILGSTDTKYLTNFNTKLKEAYNGKTK